MPETMPPTINAQSAALPPQVVPTTTVSDDSTAVPSAGVVDPLRRLEHHLLSHHHYHAAAAHRQPSPLHHHTSTSSRSGHRSHHNGTSHRSSHLSPHTASTSTAAEPSPIDSPARSPSPGARRCMATTAAWQPRLDEPYHMERRRSWDDQAYRRVMMEATGLVVEAGDPADDPDLLSGSTTRHGSSASVMGAVGSSGSSGGSISSRSSGLNLAGYDANRGFSEVVSDGR